MNYSKFIIFYKAINLYKVTNFCQFINFYKLLHPYKLILLYKPMPFDQLPSKSKSRPSRKSCGLGKSLSNSLKEHRT